MTTIQTDLRNADALTLLNTLRDLDARKVDVIHPANSMRVVNGKLVLTDVLTDDAVWQRINLDLSDTFVQGLSTKLNVPVAYLRRCLAESDARNANQIEIAGAVKFDRDPIFDQTVNYWLSKLDGNVLVRAYAGDAGTGLARAFLSDQFLTLDNIDMATAAFQGIQQAGVHAELIGADMNDRGMWLNFRCPDVVTDGGAFTQNYQYRRGGHDIFPDGTEPLVEAGFMVRNSEIGHGKAEVVPRIVVLKCTNGLTRNIDARGAIHLTKRQEQGINWSRSTTDARIDLIVKEMADIVAHFTTTSYLRAVVDQINGAAAVEIDKPQAAVDNIVKATNMPEERREALFASFMAAGPATVGNLVQAMTEVARDLGDAEESHDLELAAERVLADAAGSAWSRLV